MERKITKDEEQAFRLCSHEFEGLTVFEASIRMELREHIVRRLLRSLERKAPQLFPILTKRQHTILKMYLGNGDSQQIIARKLKTTQSNIAATIQRMKEQGVTGLNINSVGRVDQYKKSMDSYIVEKF